MPFQCLYLGQSYMPPRLKNNILPKFSHPCYNAQQRGPPFSTQITPFKNYQKSFSAKFLDKPFNKTLLLPLETSLGKSALSLSRISSATATKTSAGSAPATHLTTASGGLALSAPTSLADGLSVTEVELPLFHCSLLARRF